MWEAEAGPCAVVMGGSLGSLGRLHGGMCYSVTVISLRAGF